MDTSTRWRELAAAAREYCYLIEHVDRANSDWLQRVSCMLPRIHAAVLALNEEVDADRAPMPGPDIDLRFELFSRLRNLLGERDTYKMLFDSDQVVSDMSGSLADDITDIYFELKSGLDLLAHDPGMFELLVSVWEP